MKRVVVESGLAVVIFFAANAVFGIHAFSGSSAAVPKRLSTVMGQGPKNLIHHVEASGHAPAPDRVLGRAGRGQSVRSDVPVNCRIGHRVGALTAPLTHHVALASDRRFSDTAFLIVDSE